MADSLRKKLIRLAHDQPELRPLLLPLLKKGGGYDPNYGYYAWERGTSLRTVLGRWVERGQKIYDNSMPAYYSPRDLWPIREYTWTREEAGQGLARVDGKTIDLPGPLKWDALKIDLRTHGWDPRDPAIVDVGKNGVIKVGEGNHRLALAKELGLSKIPVIFSFQNTVRKTPQLSKAERSVPVSPKIIEKVIREPSKPLDPKTKAQVDTIMDLLGW